MRPLPDPEVAPPNCDNDDDDNGAPTGGGGFGGELTNDEVDVVGM
jgi:hypothetical protein